MQQQRQGERGGCWGRRQRGKTTTTAWTPRRSRLRHCSSPRGAGSGQRGAHHQALERHRPAREAERGGQWRRECGSAPVLSAAVGHSGSPSQVVPHHHHRSSILLRHACVPHRLSTHTRSPTPQVCVGDHPCVVTSPLPAPRVHNDGNGKDRAQHNHNKGESL
jgi:hypothetical protein